MAKITPKSKKVKGTKKKDIITWKSSSSKYKSIIVNAGNGNDIINFKNSKYTNKLNGQNGNDKIYGGKKTDTIHGNAGNDIIYGYNGNDKLYGDAGNDKIYGGNNNDYIDGGDGDDNLYGQNGNDKIYGGNGNDFIESGAGDDYIDGGNGNDKIYGNSGKNTLYGGAGNDIIYSGTGNDTFIYAKNTGHDVIYNSTNKDTLVLRNINLYGCDVRKVGNDFVIFHGVGDHTGSITLKNYFAQSASSRLKNLYFEENKQAVTLSDNMGNIINYIQGNGELYGTDGYDEFDITKGGSIVHSSADSDIVRFNKTGKNMFLDDDNSDIMIYTKLYGLTGTDTIGVPTIVGGEVELEDDLTLKYFPDPNRRFVISDFWDNPDAINATIKFHNGSKNTIRAFMETKGWYFVSGGSVTLTNEDKVIALEPVTISGGISSSPQVDIYTGNGNDIITVSRFNNNIHSNNGDDTIRILDGYNNVVHTGKGNNTVSITGGNNNIIYAEGSDQVSITGGSHNVISTYYDTKVYLNGGTNEVSLGKNSTIEINSGINNIHPDEQGYALEIVANGGNNTISGGNMNDSISATGGTLTAYGGLGNDTILGSPGNDTLCAGYNNLGSYTEPSFVGYGSASDNILDGGLGVDHLYAYGENAEMWGGLYGGGDHYYALLSNNIEIYDDETDGFFNVLHLSKLSTTTSENAYIVFDIKADGNLVDANDGILVLNSNSYNYWLNNGSFKNANNNYGGIHLVSGGSDITDDSNYAVSQIFDSSDRHVTDTQIADLAANVAGWLDGKYASVSAALTNGTDADKTALITYFNTFNNTVWTSGVG